MVDKTEVGCQLPICHILQPSLWHETMRAISQPISKGSELLSAGAY